MYHLHARPPKFIEVVDVLKELVYDDENLAHANCSILRCAHRFWHDFDTIQLFRNDLIHSQRISSIFVHFRWFSKFFEIFENFHFMKIVFFGITLARGIARRHQVYFWIGLDLLYRDFDLRSKTNWCRKSYDHYYWSKSTFCWVRSKSWFPVQRYYYSSWQKPEELSESFVGSSHGQFSSTAELL